jgi:excisionase family DNA binding protein
MPQTITVVQAAEVLNVSKHAVYQLVRTGRVRYQRIGRRYVLHHGDLQLYLEGNWRREGTR